MKKQSKKFLNGIDHAGILPNRPLFLFDGGADALKGAGPSGACTSEKGFNQKEFKEVLKRAGNLSPQLVAPGEVQPEKLSLITIEAIIDDLAVSFGMELAYAYTTVFMLFLKGASNEGSPLTTAINVVVEGKYVPITKRNLMYSYRSITGNRFLRRLARGLAIEIGQYAEKYGMDGDLAVQINNDILGDLKEENRVPLTQKERAWCSSFSQGIVNLGELSSPRLPLLLSCNKDNRFKTAAP